MAIFSYAVLLLGLVMVLLGAVQLIRLRKAADGLEATARDVAEAAHALPPELVDYLGSGERRVIAVELLNPFELAGERTWFARPLSVVTPELLRKIVNDQAVDQVREKLGELGVKADVQVHRAE